MKSTEFCYWLQGYFELNGVEDITAKQAELIHRHLQLVFKHEIDPSYPNQQELNSIHNPNNHGGDFNNTIFRC